MKLTPHLAGCTSTTQTFIPLTPWMRGMAEEDLRASIEMRQVGSNLDIQIVVGQPRCCPQTFGIVHDDAELG